jgi:hypothetical protein
MIFAGEFTLLSKTYTAENIISLNEIKERLGIFPLTNTIFDSRLSILRVSAIAVTEKILSSYLLPATMEVSLKSFTNIDYTNLPNRHKSNFFIILKSYISSINTLQYLDINKNLITMPSTQYFAEYSKKKVKISSVDDFFPDYYTVNYRGFLGAVKVNFTLSLFNNINFFKNINDPLFQENVEALLIKDSIFQYIQSRYEACEEHFANQILSESINPFVFLSTSNDFEI